MKRVTVRLNAIVLLICLMLMSAACALASEPEVAATLVVPTVDGQTEALEPILTETPVETGEQPAGSDNPLPPTIPPTALPDAPTLPTETPAPDPIPVDDGPPTYRVAYVDENDVLNVRAGAGVDSDIVGELQPDATGISITGQGQIIEGSVWVPIASGRVNGWVNSLFLTRDNKSDAACSNLPVQQLLADLQTAIAQRDNNALANLIHPERGVHVHYNWWSDEVWLRRDAVETLFTDETEYNWGTQAGSGNPQIGTFSEIMLPLLEDDLLAAEEESCNEILAGATAGLVVLPEGFEQYNYVTFYRPFPEDGIEFDWGSWVVGFEEWDGNWYISYLVHFEYEI